MNRPFLAAAAFAVWVMCAGTAGAQPTITMTDLGTLPGGTYGNAIAVNAHGEAVGMAVRADGKNRAVLFKNGSVTDLGTLCGSACPTDSADYSTTSDINDAGIVVGVSYDTSGVQQGFVWQAGVMTTLAPLPGWPETSAGSINNAGQIVGSACGSPTTGCRAVLWQNASAVPINLGVLGKAGTTEFSAAHDINSLGQIVGESTIAGATFRMHAFVWDNVNGMQDLGGTGDACFDRTLAYSINQNGEIGGGAYVSCGTSTQMTRWAGQGLEWLGGLRGPAGRSWPGTGINGAGDIPGGSDNLCGETEAVLWSRGTMIALGSPYGECPTGFAYDVNDGGQVVGYVNTGTGQIHAAMWHVQTSSPPSVTCVAPDAAPWYRGPVTVSCTVMSEIGLANSADAAFTLATAGEGTGVFTAAHAAVCDVASQCTAPIGPFGPFQIDMTAPVVTVTGVQHGLVYASDSVPPAVCTTTDALSGVQTTAALTVFGGPLGEVVYACHGAVDVAGNAATAAAATIMVIRPIPIAALDRSSTTPVVTAGYLALAPDEQRLFVVGSQGSGSNVSALFSVMNAVTYQVEGTLDLGFGFPIQMVADPNGTRAYVAMSKVSGTTTVTQDSHVAVIDVTQSPPVVAARVTLTLPNGSLVNALSGIAVHPSAPFVYVTDRAFSRLFVIDSATNVQVASVATAAGSSGSVAVQITPDGTRAYVVNRGNPATTSFVPMTVAEVNLSTLAVTAISSGLMPSGSLNEIAITPDGRRAFITSPVALENRVAVLDIDPSSPTYRTETFIETPPTSGLRDIAITRDGEYAYVVEPTGGRMLVISTDSMSVARSIPVGTNPNSVVSRLARGAKAFATVNGGVAIVAAPAPLVSVTSAAGGEAAPIALNGSVSDSDSPNPVHAWSYEAGSGTGGTCTFENATSPATSFTCDDDGTYTVTLSVDDGDNVVVTQSATILVTNAPPSATLIAPASVHAQQLFTLTLQAATDPSPADTQAGFEYAFDCGAGFGAFSTASSRTCAPLPISAEGQTVPVNGRVRDKDDGVREYAAAVSVLDRTAPVVTVPSNISRTATSDSGVAVTFTASATDNVSGALVPSCSPASGQTFDVGTTTVTCTATDAAGNATTATFTVTVSAPAVAVSAAHIRRDATINGGSRIEGSLQIMLGHTVTFNGSAMLTGDLLMAGTPTVKINGKPAYGGTTDGNGAATPSSHTVIINGGASLGRVVRRTDPLALPAVAPPPSPSGTRNVQVNKAGANLGDFATIRDLTLNGSAGTVTVPGGTYGTLTANGNSVLRLGVAGATTPTMYNVQQLTVNGNAKIEVAGPVVVTVRNTIQANGQIGNSAHPDWLTLRIAAGGLTLNGNVPVYALVEAPNGDVIVNGGSALVGRLAADRLTLNGNARLVLVSVR